MDTGLWNRITILDRNLQLTMTAVPSVPNVECAPLDPPNFHAWPPDPVFIPPSPSSDFETEPEIWYLQALVYEFQSIVRPIAVYVGEHETPTAVARTIMDEVHDDTNGDRFVYIVQRQPPGDSIAAILTSTWMSGYGLHAAFVDARGAGGDQCVVYVGGYVSREIVQTLLGMTWQGDFRVFVGISNVPLGPEDVAPTFQGILIRVRFPGYDVPAVQWLERRMFPPGL